MIGIKTSLYIYSKCKAKNIKNVTLILLLCFKNILFQEVHNLTCISVLQILKWINDKNETLFYSYFYEYFLNKSIALHLFWLLKF